MQWRSERSRCIPSTSATHGSWTGGAETAEARADEAEGRIVELKKKMVDEAHRIAFQQRIFNMELVQLEQDLDKTRRSAVQQDKANGDMINKLMNYNEEYVQMIDQLRQQHATLMAQIKSALPTGSDKNPKPSAAACSSSVATSAPPADSAKKPGKRARSDNPFANTSPTAAPAAAEASVAAVSPPSRKLGLEDCGGCHLHVIWDRAKSSTDPRHKCRSCGHLVHSASYVCTEAGAKNTYLIASEGKFYCSVTCQMLESEYVRG